MKMPTKSGRLLDFGLPPSPAARFSPSQGILLPGRPSLQPHGSEQALHLRFERICYFPKSHQRSHYEPSQNTVGLSRRYFTFKYRFCLFGRYLEVCTMILSGPGPLRHGVPLRCLRQPCPQRSRQPQPPWGGSGLETPPPLTAGWS